ncbi:MAG: hypothetical protein HY319_27895 [Armatimonadetes bacterium]|nr:hypothetical protein [Armatimonadota bacterium]
MDGICAYLPDPTERTNTGLDQAREEAEVELSSDPQKPFVGLAFKLEDERFGQLTYMRIPALSRSTPALSSRRPIGSSLLPSVGPRWLATASSMLPVDRLSLLTVLQ